MRLRWRPPFRRGSIRPVPPPLQVHLQAALEHLDALVVDPSGSIGPCCSVDPNGATASAPSLA
jgi:hypothetical protein